MARVAAFVAVMLGCPCLGCGATSSDTTPGRSPLRQPTAVAPRARRVDGQAGGARARSRQAPRWPERVGQNRANIAERHVLRRLLARDAALTFEDLDLPERLAQHGP